MFWTFCNLNMTALDFSKVNCPTWKSTACKQQVLKFHAHRGRENQLRNCFCPFWYQKQSCRIFCNLTVCCVGLIGEKYITCSKIHCLQLVLWFLCSKRQISLHLQQIGKTVFWILYIGAWDKLVKSPSYLVKTHCLQLVLWFPMLIMSE